MVGHSLGGHLVQVFSQFFPQSVEAAYTFNAPGFGGALTQLVDFFFPASIDIDSSLVSNLVANHGFDVTARLGVVIGGTTRIFNEAGGNPVDNHFMEKLIDSLALYNLFSQLDPSPSLYPSPLRDSIGEILDASSNLASNSLEVALDALHRTLNGGLPMASTQVGDRALFSQGVVDLLQRIPAVLAEATPRIQSLVHLSPAAIAGRALQADGVAYRYALDRLLPYAIEGLDYAPLDPRGALALGSVLSDSWINDRAELLSWKIARNLTDAGGAIRRTDGGAAINLVWSEGEERVSLQVRPGVLPVALARHVFFGGPGNDEYSGLALDDRLYGGAGEDTLHGGGGVDRLEGGDGNDRLFGDDGDDTFIGGLGDDILDGGAGINRLEGGAGFDRYEIAAGSAAIINDSDGLGLVRLNGVSLAGGAGGHGLFWSDDRSVYYTLSSAANGARVLGVNGTLVIEGFVNGQFGISLAGDDGTVNPPTTALGERHYLDSAVSAEESALAGGDPDYLFEHPFGSPADDILVAGTNWHRFFLGRDGDDYLEGGEGTEALLGGPGHDHLVSGERSLTGAPVLSGGAGNDFIVGSDQDDVIYGDFYVLTGASNANGSIGFRIDEATWRLFMPGVSAAFAGGLTEMPFSPFSDSTVSSLNWGFPLSTESFEPFLDYVFGASRLSSPASYDDFIEGGDGNDVIIGGAGDDAIYGGAGNDIIYGDHGRPRESPYAGAYFPADVAVFGEPIAALFGAPGDDFIDAGDGDDLIIDTGGVHSTVLGGEGNDRIFVTVGVEEEGGYFSSGSASIEAGGGNDTIEVASAWMSIAAGDGDDEITATGPNLWVNAGDGDNRIAASVLWGMFYGGNGNDTYGLGRLSQISAEALAPRNYWLEDDSGDDVLELPADPTLYVITRSGDDLKLTLDAPGQTALAQAGLDAATSQEQVDYFEGLLGDLDGLPAIRVTVANWFASTDRKIETISFEWGAVWGIDDVEAHLADSDVAGVERSFAIDLAFDPGATDTGGEDAPLPAIVADNSPAVDTIDVPIGESAPLAGESAGGDPLVADIAPAVVQEQFATLGRTAPLFESTVPSASAADVPFSLLLSATAPVPANPARSLRSVEDGPVDAASPVQQATEQLIAAFFERAAAPPLVAQPWLDTWVPAGDRGATASASAQVAPSNDSQPDLENQAAPPAEANPSEAPPDETGRLSPEEVAQQYDRIDAWLAENAGFEEGASSGAFMPASMGGMPSMMVLQGELTQGLRFGSTPGLVPLGGWMPGRLSGLSEGLRTLG